VSERGTDGARPGREALRASLARTPTCIPLERLGEPLTEHEREHVQECARCQTELALREEFEQLGVDLVDLVAEILERHGLPFVEQMG